METITELEELQTKNGANPLKIEEYTAIFNKNGLKPQELPKYDKIYMGYKELINYLNEINIKYENASKYINVISPIVPSSSSIEPMTDNSGSTGRDSSRIASFELQYV